MGKRSEEAAMKAYPKEEGKMYSTAFGMVDSSGFTDLKKIEK